MFFSPSILTTRSKTWLTNGSRGMRVAFWTNRCTDEHIQWVEIVIKGLRMTIRYVGVMRKSRNAQFTQVN
jgi:hypothetical protein